MKRREFGKVITSGSVVAAASGGEITAAVKPKKALMHVGCQSQGTSVEALQFLKRHGVNNIDGGSPSFIPGRGWDLDEILTIKDRCETHGVSLDAFHIPLTSSGISRVQIPNIMLGKSPERDRDIEIVQQMIETSAKAGIFLLNYNLIILEVLRTERTPGRGGSNYSTWVYEKAKDAPLTMAGQVSADDMWERITYFLEKVIPVATEHKVRMGCHLPDPPTPPGYRGITRVLGLPKAEGMKRFIEISPSPYHGFNFCIGSFAEGLDDPGNEIYEYVRYFGERKKIFNVHFRNIRGKRDNFQEVYPDNGDIDMYRLMKVFRDVEYPYMLMPDHVPSHPAQGAGSQAYAFAYGYIKALIQAVNSEA